MFLCFYDFMIFMILWFYGFYDFCDFYFLSTWNLPYCFSELIK